MAGLSRFKRSWCAAAGLSLAVVGCSTTSKTSPLAAKHEQAAATAVSGSGEFAPDTGAKNPTKIHLAYAQWQEQMGQQPEARESYAKVLAEQPKNVEALLGMARLDQASGLMTDAENRLKKAIKLSPKDPRVLATYGNFYAGQGEWKQAIEKHQAAVKQSPDDPRYQFLLGVALARNGDVDTALPYFIRSVDAAQAHYNVGYILYESGDRAASLAHFEKALQLKPDLEVAQTMIDRIQQRSDNTMLAGGTDRTKTGLNATPASSVRAVPIVASPEQVVPLRGNEASLPSRMRNGAVATPAPTTVPKPPAGLTPAQLEQWRNQQR